MIRIAFEKVTKSFAGHEVLRDVSAVCHGGSITVAAGLNGSGKSTLLKLAGHLLLPDSGRITVKTDAIELKGEALRMRLSMMTPELRLYPRLSAKENLSFFLGLRGVSMTELQYGELLERVGLSAESVRDTAAEAFSTGMRQRLHFALMLAAEADIWLLDEPGANLDEAGRELMRREIRQAAEAGKLVLLATNDGRERSMADETTDLSRH